MYPEPYGTATVSTNTLFSLSQSLRLSTWSTWSLWWLVINALSSGGYLISISKATKYDNWDNGGNQAKQITQELCCYRNFRLFHYPLKKRTFEILLQQKTKNELKEKWKWICSKLEKIWHCQLQGNVHKILHNKWTSYGLLQRRRRTNAMHVTI